jgi:hypothetical protein
MPLTQRAASSSVPYSVNPLQTYPPTQGAISLYRDGSCESPLSDTATPVILGKCTNMPFPGIQGVSIDSVPTCYKYGTPLLIVSDQIDCKNSTLGAGADSGVVGMCQSYSTGANIGSVQFVCYGSGISAVSPTSTSPSTSRIPMISTTPGVGQSQSSNGGSDNSETCCCCTVM